MSVTGSTNNSLQPAPSPNLVVARPHLRWRVIDITVASVVAVASSFIYWAAIFIPWYPLQAVTPGFGGIINGLWLFAGPLAAIIVRKPGAALYAELLAAVVESLLGNQWGGAATLLIGGAEGLAAEIAFAIFAYRVWNVGVTMLAGALSGVACGGYSFLTHLQAVNFKGYGPIYVGFSALSGVVIAGLLMWWLYRAIAKTGVLDKFESGRQVRGTVA